MASKLKRWWKSISIEIENFFIDSMENEKRSQTTRVVFPEGDASRGMIAGQIVHGIECKVCGGSNPGIAEKCGFCGTWF